MEENNKNDYSTMWEKFAQAKSAKYLNYKFNPNHRVGLTNYLREHFIYEFLEPQKNDIILDFGCASGRQLFAIASSIKAGYGLDIAQNFIDMANQYKIEHAIDNVFFQTSDIDHIPFADGFFDKIICGEVLEHVFDKDIALKELLRVLKPGGILVITVPNMNADATLWGRLGRLLKIRKFIPITVFSKEELIKHGDAHVREFTKKTLMQFVEQHDLNIKKIQSISFIDGPKWFEFLLKILLHIKIIQRAIIAFEKILTKLNLFFGRQLIIKVSKK